MAETVQLHLPAPDFELQDFKGHTVRLSEYQGKKHVVLVFNRGFSWPFCHRHLAQLRQDYDKFLAQDAEILVTGPEDAAAFRHYWRNNKLPFPGLPDPNHTVLKLYGQQVKLFKFGRMPAQVIVDSKGLARYVHYGQDMSDIPANKEILAALAQMGAPPRPADSFLSTRAR